MVNRRATLFVCCAFICLGLILSSCQVAAPSAAQTLVVPQLSPIPIVKPALQYALALNSEIWLANADGSNLVNLTNHPADYGTPSWSADGMRLAYCAKIDGTTGIYIMDVTSRTAKVTTVDVPTCTHPWTYDLKWSPDGKWLAFTSMQNDLIDLYLSHLDGSGLVKLTERSTKRVAAIWSPDSQSLLVSYDRQGQENIYRINLMGEVEARLTDQPYTDVPCQFSPDGSQVLMMSARDGPWQIYTMRADGSTVTRLTEPPATHLNPVWSVDGKWIYFTSNRDGNVEIYRMNADGSEQTNLSKDTADDHWFWLSPDGESFVFLAAQDNQWDVWTMKQDGSDVKKLTGVLGGIGNVAWRPLK